MYPTAPDFLLKRSMQQIFQYDTMHLVDTLLTQPIIIIAGSEADTKFMGDEIFSKSKASKYKKNYVIEGASHVDLYDKLQYINPTIDYINQFFKEN